MGCSSLQITPDHHRTQHWLFFLVENELIETPAHASAPSWFGHCESDPWFVSPLNAQNKFKRVDFPGTGSPDCPARPSLSQHRLASEWALLNLPIIFPDSSKLWG